MDTNIVKFWVERDVVNRKPLTWAQSDKGFIMPFDIDKNRMKLDDYISRIVLRVNNRGLTAVNHTLCLSKTTYFFPRTYWLEMDLKEFDKYRDSWMEARVL